MLSPMFPFKGELRADDDYHALINPVMGVVIDDKRTQKSANGFCNHILIEMHLLKHCAT